jgi:hypothetical protein
MAGSAALTRRLRALRESLLRAQSFIDAKAEYRYESFAIINPAD